MQVYLGYDQRATRSYHNGVLAGATMISMRRGANYRKNMLKQGGKKTKKPKKEEDEDEE
jgi:hypothetical protein